MSITTTTNYYKQVSDTGDGTKVGSATSDKLGFYGLSTPIVCPTMSNAAVATTSTTVMTTYVSSFGFSTSTATLAVVNLLNEIRAKLVALGLVQ